MITYCGPGCSCLIPFPHILVTTQRTVKTDGEVQQVTVKMWVCKLCNHMVANPYPVCRCPASCHSEARNGEKEGIEITAKAV